RGRGWRGSFYYRGTAGLLARLGLINAHVLHRLREPIQELLEARTIEQQRDIYEERIRPRFWTPWLRWVLSRRFTLTLLGLAAARPDHDAVRRRRVAVRPRRGRGGPVRTSLPRQLFLARLHPGPVHARLLPRVPQTRQLRAPACPDAEVAHPHLHCDGVPAP